MNRVRIVKVGGSLLEWPALADTLKTWLARETTPAVLICGGGRWADAVRCSWQTHQLTEQAAHWLCIQAMGISAHLLAELTHLPLTHSRHEAELCGQVQRNDCMIACVEPFLRNTEPAVAGLPLPQDWSTTSDSIAARFAKWLQAEELVLLKSASPPSGSQRHWAEVEYVDAWFPQAAADYGGAVRAINLRTWNATVKKSPTPK